jgi:predicted DNA-binding transcriptional regulator AlpA
MAPAKDLSSTGLVLIEKDEVKAKIGVRSDSYLFQMVKENRFPRPIKGSRRFSRWVLQEVDAWIAQKIQERDQQPEAA